MIATATLIAMWSIEGIYKDYMGREKPDSEGALLMLLIVMVFDIIMANALSP